MNRAICPAALFCCVFIAQRSIADPPVKPFVTGMKNPESATVGLDGRIYVSMMGKIKEKGEEGSIVVIEDGKAVPFAKGMDNPRGIVAFQKWIFVADNTRVWRVDMKGKAEIYADEKDFPTPPLFLNDITVDPETGTIFVSDSGDLKGKAGAVYRITSKVSIKKGEKKPVFEAVLAKVETLVDTKSHPELNTPNGVCMDGKSFLLLADFGSGILYRIKLADKSMEKIADGMDGADGVVFDYFGRLYISSWKTGKIFGIPRPGMKPILMAEGFESAADICLDKSGNFLLVPDMKAGTLSKISTKIPGWEVDDTPLKLETTVAFPNLKWTGWKGETDSGKVLPLRPVLLTHAGDGSNRVFVGIQQGTIHVFPNDPKADKTRIFLDIEKKVYYKDSENEQGLLGLAFHPKYEKNGEFFVFYTSREVPKNAVKPPVGIKMQAPPTNVISRFKVSKDDPNKADPDSEEILLKIDRPFWNHDGGTICFGPDGYLYIAVGDGGLADDPFNNGQNLNTLLGKILRIDVDHKEGGKNYAIPKDNPFAGKAKLAEATAILEQYNATVARHQVNRDRIEKEVNEGVVEAQVLAEVERLLRAAKAEQKAAEAAVEKAKAIPETWAYGLRNVWRMSFDKKTGWLWAADVGQNLYEEINIITKGGNYGWRRREGLHPFGPTGTGPIPELIDPIWEYHHDVGKSVTGGLVYRGKLMPQLEGAYVYGDYVTNKIWALRYDDAKKRVVANQPIRDRNVPVMSFGEDERGEIYLMTYSATGQGVFQIVPAKE